MPTIEVPKGPVEIADDKHVPEIYVNGPFNVMEVGGMVLLTLTVARPDIGEVMAGKTHPSFKGTVAARILMPPQMASEIVQVMGQTLSAGAAAAKK